MLYDDECLLTSGLMDSLRTGDINNWSLNPEQFSDLASSLNKFFSQVKNESTEQQTPLQHQQQQQQQQGTPATTVSFSTSQDSHTSNISGN